MVQCYLQFQVSTGSLGMFPPVDKGRLLYSHVCMCTSCLGTNLLGQRTNNFFFLIKMVCQTLQKFSYTNVYEILHLFMSHLYLNPK